MTKGLDKGVEEVLSIDNNDSAFSKLFHSYKDAYFNLIKATEDLRSYLANSDNKEQYEDSVEYASFLVESIMLKQFKDKLDKVSVNYNLIRNHQEEELTVLNKLFGIGQMLNKIILDSKITEI